MRVIFAILALALGLQAPGAARAAGFDGRWVADIPEQNRCDIPGQMTLVVSGHDVLGEVHRTVGSNPNTGYIVGKVDDNGAGTFTVGSSPAGTLRFSGDRFDATWNNGFCDRHVEGGRAPDAAGLAAAAADRRDHQARYADLMRRAQAGDGTVDYAVLRAESVYAPSWDFYDSKVSGLLDQAAAAVKGEDCREALPILDSAIKLDFTLDSAHALRSDCLAKAGNQEGARIEAAIADGLIHSLVDSAKDKTGLTPASASADGASEARAYVVVTDREVQDVLANRRIQVKTAQTQIRGSDGRYYELMKGVSLGAGPAADVAMTSIYFDITSFMTGQASRRSAVAEAVAQIH